MDSQFAGGPLPPDKHAKDVPFLDKYALERWEVGCLLFCVPMIFDCSKLFYLVVCLTTILRVPVIILTLINLHSTIHFLVQSVEVCRYVSVFCSDFSVCSSFYGGLYWRNRGSQQRHHWRFAQCRPHDNVTLSTLYLLFEKLIAFLSIIDLNFCTFKRYK